MAAKHHLWQVFLASAALAPAFAQEGGLKPVEEAPPPVKDLGGWLGEEKQPAAPAPVLEGGGAAPAQGGDPLAPGAAPAPAAAAEPVDPAKAAEEERKRGRTIDGNYKRALDVYEDMGQPHHALASLDKRIANNERIVRDYSERLAKSGDERRRLQVELFNRTYYLRQQQEKGQIDQPTFDRLIAKEEREYEQRVVNLKSDIKSWQKEVAEAQKRLETLRNERRLLVASLPREGRKLRGDPTAKAKPRPGQKLLSTLDAQLRQLEKFEPRNTMDDVHPRDVGVSSVGRPPMDEGAEASSQPPPEASEE